MQGLPGQRPKLQHMKPQVSVLNAILMIRKHYRRTSSCDAKEGAAIDRLRARPHDDADASRAARSNLEGSS